MEPKRILIVEDNPDIADIEREYLELSGYVVAVAPDGASGLEGVKKAIER